MWEGLARVQAISTSLTKLAPRLRQDMKQKIRLNFLPMARFQMEPFVIQFIPTAINYDLFISSGINYYLLLLKSKGII